MLLDTPGWRNSHLLKYTISVEVETEVLSDIDLANKDIVEATCLLYSNTAWFTSCESCPRALNHSVYRKHNPARAAASKDLSIRLRIFSFFWESQLVKRDKSAGVAV